MHDVPVEVSADSFAVHEPDPDTLIGFLQLMEFNSITKRAATHFGLAEGTGMTANTSQTIFSAPSPAAAKPAGKVPDR